MSSVNSVLGPVDVENLGRVLMHEHVFTLNAELRDEYPWDEDAVVASAVAELSDLKAHGIDTIVDLTVFGLGRNIRRIRRIAEQVDLQIIPATGIYTYHDLPSFFALNEQRKPGFITDFLVREIEGGVDDTGIRPAILKVAVDHHGVTPDLDFLLRATARAHRRTGAPIKTHADAHSKQGLAQQRIFSEEGVDLSRVIIGHVGDAKDLSYAEELIAAGSTVGLDRLGAASIGANAITPDERVDVIIELVRRGYADRILLSHDTHVRSDSIDRRLRESNTPDWRYTHIPDVVVPRLLEAGISQEDIDQMLVKNPQRIFSETSSY